MIRIPSLNIACWLTLGLLSGAFAQGTVPRTVSEFRGVRPGETTRAQLLAKSDWQAAFTAERKHAAAFVREYAFKPWQAVAVVIVGDTVQAIDFLPPENANYAPAQLAQVMQLGEPAPIARLPEAARFGMGEEPAASLLRSKTHHAVFMLEKLDDGGVRVSRVRMHASPVVADEGSRPSPQPATPSRVDAPAVAGALTPFPFRGVVPGATTRKQLIANDLWGEPFETSPSDDGEVLRYRLRGYPDARVLIRGGRVQTLDVVLADGVGEDLAASSLGLGEPRDAPVSESARVGAIQPPAEWTARPYSAGRVVLYVETVGGRSLARLMRAYSPVLARGEQFVPLDAGDTEVRVRGQDEQSRQLVRHVVELLDEVDFLGRKLDDEMAVEWMEQFLLTLDSGKNYLLAEDVARFRTMAPSIVGRAKQGDIGFAYDAFETYLKRRDEVLGLVGELLAAEHDFTLDEELTLAGPETPWPENAIEAREIWRKHVKNQLLTRRIAGATEEEAVERVRRHYEAEFRLPKRVDDGTLLEWTLTALGTARGGTARYYSPHALEQSRIQTHGRIVGIGASLQLVDGEVVVRSLVPGSPAHADGRIAPGDVFVSVGQGDAGPTVPLAGLRLEESIGHIRGPEGATVRLTVRPKSGGAPFTVRLRRADISLVSVRGTVLEVPGGRRKVGWIAATQFYVDTAGGRSSVGDMTRMLEGFRAEGVDAVVLDLRICGGGPLGESIDVFGLFAEGVTLQSKDATGGVQVYETQPTVKIAWHGPLVVLTGQNTGSGAAIVAAAVKNYQRGLVVGDSRTMPDAQIQRIVEVGPRLTKNGTPPNLGAVRYTWSVFYRLDGFSSHGRGVPPDLTLPSFTEHSVAETGATLSVPGRIEAAKYNPLGLVTPAIITTLASKSQQRRRASAGFVELEQQIEQFKRLNQRRNVPLSEAVRRAEQMPEIDHEFPDLQREEFIRHGPYVDEVLAITQDYVDHVAWLAALARAWDLLRAGSSDAAAAGFDKLGSTAGDAPAPHLGRAYVRAATGDWKQAIEHLKKSGADGIRVEVVTDTELRVKNDAVAAVKRGDRLLVANQNGEWLWAILPGDRSKKGWVKGTAVRVVVP